MSPTQVYASRPRSARRHLTGDARFTPPCPEFHGGTAASLTSDEFVPLTREREMIQTAPTMELPEWVATFVSDINRAARLGSNWDGYGAAPLDEDAVWAALELLGNLAVRGPAPRVSVTADGGLRMEWSSPDAELAIEVEADRSVSVLWEFAGEDFDWESSVFGDGKLGDALDHFALQ